MINKKYWDDFYKNTNLTTAPSDFAEYVYNFLNENGIDGKLIDVACGNGRDSLFFSKNGIETTGLDLSSELNEIDFKFIKGNLLSFDYRDFDLIYLRFIVHSITEDELDNLLENLSKTNAFIFIETRSSKGISDKEKEETFFKSSIGDKHFRMLYSKNYLDSKLSKIFDILESSEGLYSNFKGDNPFCIRYILKPKNK